MNFSRFGIVIGCILLLFGAQAQTKKRANDPDLREIRDYRLTMDIVQRYVKAADVMQKDPAVAKCFNGNGPGNAATLDAGEKMFNACTAGLADIKGAGLKPREFLIVTAALIGDMMAAGMKKGGTVKEYPDSISPENAAFFDQNYDKVQAVLAPLMGGSK